MSPVLETCLLRGAISRCLLVVQKIQSSWRVNLLLVCRLTACTLRLIVRVGCRAEAAAAAEAQEQLRRGRRVEEQLPVCEHCPPAAAGRDTYTLLKFYNLSSSLLNSIFQVTRATDGAPE